MTLVGLTEQSREPLSRERVLETAVALADRHGLDWLSMRKLAEELGVAAMTLYYRRALSTRAALNRHRWAVGNMEGRTDHGPSNLRLHDAVLGCLRAAGFSLELSVSAYSVQDAYIYGFALQETDMSSETSEDFAAEAQRQMDAYAEMLADYPNLVEVVGGHVAQVGYDYAKEFLFGLDLILDGLDRLRN